MHKPTVHPHVTPISLVPQHTAVPGLFNPTRLERHLRQNPSRAQAVLDMVAQLIAADLTPIHAVREAIEHQAFVLATHRLRTLSGSVGNLGGQRVCEVTEDIERLLDKNRAAELQGEWLNCLEREFTQFLHSARLWLQQQQARRSLFAITADEAYRLQVDELKTCLRDQNLKAFELFDALQPRLRQALSDTDFNDFSAALSNLNFAQALHHMNVH